MSLSVSEPLASVLDSLACLNTLESSLCTSPSGQPTCKALCDVGFISGGGKGELLPRLEIGLPPPQKYV